MQTRPAGARDRWRAAFKVVYTTESAAECRSPGKRVTLMVDRYYLSHAGQECDRRSRYTGRCRQRRRVPVDDPELPVEVKSLWREPERQRAVSFGALEFHDVFKIFSSGPAETVALRGLDLRIEPARARCGARAVRARARARCFSLAAGLDQPSAGEVRVFGRSLTAARRAEPRRLPRARRGDRLPERQSLAVAFGPRERRARAATRGAAPRGRRRAGTRRFGLTEPAARRAGTALGWRAAARRDRRGRGARGARSCSPTSRPPSSTRRTSGSCSMRLRGCGANSAARSSSSPTRRVSRRRPTA